MASLLAQPSSSPSSGTASAVVNQRQSLGSSPEEGLIALDVTVTDAAGKPVVGLDHDDFTLLDNGKPAKIATFHAYDEATAKPDDPTELILVLDQRNQKSSEAAEAEKALNRFLRQGGGHLAFPTSICRLSLLGMSATLKPSTDGNALADALVKKGGLRPVPRHFSSFVLPDNNERSYSFLLSQSSLGAIIVEARRNPARKLVVWIGAEGLASASNLDRPFDATTEFSTRLREARITLYKVNAWNDPRRHPYNDFLDGVVTEKNASFALVTLEVLAEQSGGAVLEMEPTDDAVKESRADRAIRTVVDSLARILAENSSFYRLTFDPARTERIDEYHGLKLEIRKPGLVAHTRTAYYDEPVFYDQPHIVPQHLTVAQLEQKLRAGSRTSDAELVNELSTIELTERMSTMRLMAWKDRLRGKKAWQALVAVADASAFLDLPPEDLPFLLRPSDAERHEQFLRIVNYLGDIAPKLPNLIATRSTDRYEEPSQRQSETWKTARLDRSLHLETSNVVTVVYRNGGDFVEAPAGKEKKAKKGPRALETNGTFGPILSIVVSDAVHGKITWGGWEKGASGIMAVFRYSVPESQSHYEVSACCYPEHLGGGRFQRQAGYHGKIAFDPATGAILRLTVQTDLNEKLLLLRSDIAVEYGTVETGGRTCVCPMRSVSISRGRTLRSFPEWNEVIETYGPFETLLTDVSFSDYHRFISTSRILPAFY